MIIQGAILMSDWYNYFYKTTKQPFELPCIWVLLGVSKCCLLFDQL